jgi:tRNA nucleotidyltransferase (CCA-adding enzyme)
MSLERADIFIASLGLEAYRVGGAVRDELLGKTPKDADYMIRGIGMRDLGRVLRIQIVRLNYNGTIKPLVLRDGRQAGWRVAARGLGCIEIVLPRTEHSTGPGHRDFEIVIDARLTLAEDAMRRDFTWNALYKTVPTQHVNGWGDSPYGDMGIIDPSGRGLYDLQHKLVNTTHPTSFRDDPLRTLRALRFVSTLGYDLSTNAHNEMCDYAEAVTGLSAKGYASGTVLDEMSRILMGDDCVKALRLARDTGVLTALFPNLAPMISFEQGSRYHDMTTDEHTFAAMQTAVNVGAPLRVRWALLFHDSGKPESCWTGADGRKHYYAHTMKAEFNGVDTEVSWEDHEVVGERVWRQAGAWMNADKSLREDVATLIREHMVPIKPHNVGTRVRRMRVQLGDDLLRDLLIHRACDLSGKGAMKQNLDAITVVAQMEQERRNAALSNVPAKTTDLAVNGQDCMDQGLSGRDIGLAMKALLDEVVCQPDELHMSREWQLKRIGALKRV